MAAATASTEATASTGPPLLLALSVHGDDCSVAVGTGDDPATEVWSRQPERTTTAGAGSQAGPLASRDALLLLDRLLNRTGISLTSIDRLCFARGPGAFTALRVAAGLVQGLSLAISRPVAGICSLAAMAADAPAWRPSEGAARSWLQLSAIDARMGECYFGLHQCLSGHHPQALLPAAVGKPQAAVALFRQVMTRRESKREGASPSLAIAGDGFLLLPELAHWAQQAGFDPRAAAGHSPTAAAVLAVAASIGAPPAGPPDRAQPAYVRDKVALDVTEQRERAAARALAAVGDAFPRGDDR